MNARFILSTVLFCLIAAGCQKEIVIKPIQHSPKIFIEGMLYPGKKPQIYVSKSNPFFSSRVTPQQIFARGAVVKISTSTTIDVLVTDSTFNKFRCRWEPFYLGSIAAEHGTSYTLTVYFEGKTYSASTTISQRAPKIESIEYTPAFYDVYGGHDGVIVSIKDHQVVGDYYRFQMNRMIDNSVLHAHVLDVFVNNCTQPDELFEVRDIGRVVFSDKNVDGQKIVMMVEVTYEYSKGDEGLIFIQSIDKSSAAFYIEIDKQLQAIKNPFVEPVFINTKIEGAIGVFGSAVSSDSVLFVYPQDHP